MQRQEKWRVKDKEYTFTGYPAQAVEDWNAIPEEFEEAHCLDFYGGDLQGMEKKIPYLQELGVNGIYLNPIFSAATVHKYDCIDYFHVDKHLGGDLAFADFMQALHEQDMRLILDISINHTGSGHKWFNAEGFYEDMHGAYADTEAKEREYYYFEEDGSYGCYGNLPSLPKLNYHSEELRNILYKGEDSVLRKWLKSPYQIDGWRFDVAATTGQYKLDHFEHEIWPEIRSAIKETKPDAYILAEDWNDGYDFLQGNEWDGIMNFFGCGRPVRDYVGQLDFRHGRNKKLKQTLPNTSGKALAERILSLFGKLPYVIQESQFNMLDCHDISRLHNHSEISFSQYEMAVYLMYILPGAVCIYYGDEIGLDGRLGSAEGCRYPMNWEEKYKENRYFQLYQSMNLERKQSEALQYGGFKILVAENKVFVCARFTKDVVYLVVTSMEQEKTEEVVLNLKIFGDCFQMPEMDRMGRELRYSSFGDGKVKLEVPPFRGYFIRLKNCF